jgi:ComF family protein
MKYSQAGNACQPTIAALVDRWREPVTTLREHVTALLWPSTCVLCRQSAQKALDLCLPCAGDLPTNDFACKVCAEPLPAPAAMLVCGACLRRPPPFQRGFAPFMYGYPLDHLIRGLKFRGELACGRVLGELFAQRLLHLRDGTLPELIIPVPLAPRRYRERGYNQAVELALPIAKRSGISLRTDLVVRQRETVEQTALNQKERRKNVRRAFALTAALPAHHIAILDDVVTTGSTVREIAKVLRRAGASRVEIWAIAKAGHHLNTYSSAIPMKTDMPK